MYHNRNMYNIIDMLSELGGLLGASFSVLQVILQYINLQFIMGKFIRNIYFLEMPEKKRLGIFKQIFTRTKVITIKFNWWIKMLEAREFIHIPFNMCRRKKSQKDIVKISRTKKDFQELVFIKGREMAMNEMNIYTIIQTLQKLKAGLSVLVNDDKEILQKIHKLYVKNAII